MKVTFYILIRRFLGTIWDNECGKFENRYIRGRAAGLLPSSQTANKTFQKAILFKMQVDDVFYIVRNDALILRLGEKVYKKAGIGPKSLHYARNGSNSSTLSKTHWQ